MKHGLLPTEEKGFENFMGKGEIAGYQYLNPPPPKFSTLLNTYTR